MLKCDYCCVRPSSLKITCLKCSSNRSIQICYKCSINVSQLREHSRIHPLSTYELVDIPLDENNLSEWLCNDEINLIEMIETCGLGNWLDISSKLSKNIFDCQNHFEDIYLSRSTSSYSICFQSFPNTKQLIGENVINDQNFQLNSLIYPPMLIDSEQQKMLTYMPQRDEYEREYLNQAENRLPISNNDELFNEQQEQDGSRLLVHKAKLALLRSYKQILKRRFKLKDFIRDYAIGFNYSPDQEMDLHQISRFLSADEYERLIYNHRRIRSLLEELGCSTSSNGHHDQSQSKGKKSSTTNSEKRRRRAPSIVVDESSSSSSSSSFSSSSSSSSSAAASSSASASASSPLSSSESNESNLSLSSNNQSEESNSKLKRRSVRRVSSSSTNTSSKTTTIKEPLYTRRRVNQSDTHSVSQRMTRSTGNASTALDISWNSSDEEMNEYNDYQFGDDESTVASRTRSHTPPNHHQEKKQRTSPNGKRSNNHLNGSSRSNIFDPSDESTPKVNRMLTRHQLVVQQTSPNKKRKINSNTIDDEVLQT